jgi:hypothetical protein
MHKCILIKLQALRKAPNSNNSTIKVLKITEKYAHASITLMHSALLPQERSGQQKGRNDEK